MTATGVDIPSSYWVVIPAYNEAPTVRDVAVRAKAQCPNVIVVDDGSSDETAAQLAGLDLVVLRNDENMGKAGSLMCGFRHALDRGATGIITLDGDGQHDPKEIWHFIESAQANVHALILGSRHREQRRSSTWRYCANCIADFWISWAAGQWIEDSQSGFRLYPAKLMNDVQVSHGKTRSFVFESEILIEAARKKYLCYSVPISVGKRHGQRGSHFRPIMDIARITMMVSGKLLIRGMNMKGLWSVMRAVHAEWRISDKPTHSHL